LQPTWSRRIESETGDTRCQASRTRRRLPIRCFTATPFVVLAASFLATAPALAAPRDLDNPFSDDGKAITDIGVSRIDEVAIYNLALSEAEVRNHFKASGR